ncbi:MAG: hypothetical protein GX564_01025 [Oligosphaeraceae bacterium]|nr:hypothetical protein [Oligosphaeraceae bacterium]
MQQNMDCNHTGTAAGCCAVLNSVSGSTVNVLTLGVKNDGSEDISEIVNRETEKHALYFPAGIYKVAQPIFLQNPVSGAGYSRTAKVTGAHTWLVSEIKNDDASVGVLNITAAPAAALNIESLNLQCSSHECAIRIAPECSGPHMVIDKVGLFKVQSYGVFINGRGSRPFFLQNMTIWGAREWPVPGVGIHLEGGTCDNRFSNLEIMGCRISLELYRGYHYGNNLHLWTGSMCGKDNGTWWRGTRSIVLKGAFLNASEVYPDTSFYALEACDETASFHLHNIFYWEDNSAVESPDYDGAFFHGKGFCQISGGEIAVMERGTVNGRMQQVRMAGQNVKNVVIRTNLPVAAENIDKLCAGDELPDYTLEYTQTGFCKAGDFVLASASGCTESRLTLDNGEGYLIRILRSADGVLEQEVQPLNRLCRKGRVQFKEMGNNVYSLFVHNDKEQTLRFRFQTVVMGERFRPLHLGLLRNTNNSERVKLVLPQL